MLAGSTAIRGKKEINMGNNGRVTSGAKRCARGPFSADDANSPLLLLSSSSGLTCPFLVCAGALLSSPSSSSSCALPQLAAVGRRRSVRVALTARSEQIFLLACQSRNENRRRRRVTRRSR